MKTTLMAILCVSTFANAAFVSNVAVEISCPYAVTISWLGSASVGFNVYRSTSSIGTKTFVGSTNSTTKSGTDATAAPGSSYYYWIEAVDNASTYMSVTYAYTTVPSSLSTPFAPTVQGTSTSVSLSWSYFSNEDGMYIYRSTDYGSYYYVATITSAITSSWVDFSVLPGHTYSYKISAYNECGESSASFASSSVVMPTLPDLIADSLTVFVSHDTLFGRFIVMNIGEQSAGPFYAVAQCNGSTILSSRSSVNLNSYYYFIYTFVYKTSTPQNAVAVYADYYGDIIEGSEGNNYLTVNRTSLPTSAPLLVSPLNNTIDIPLSILLSWVNPGGATGYQLQVATDPAFNSLVINNAAILSTSATLSDLGPSTIYYWRVSAQNGGGNSSWSMVRTFTTVPPVPSAPVLMSPIDNSVDQGTDLMLSWAGVTGSSTYHLQVAASGTFASALIDDSTLVSPSRNTGFLSTGTKYYWRVSSKNPGGKSGWSQVWSFTTVPPPTGAPILLMPANASIGQAVNASLSWNEVAGATGYCAQVAADASFEHQVAVDSLLTLPSKALASLSTNTQYFWHVYARNAGGKSPWSQTWAFTTVPTQSGSPTPQLPSNNSADQALAVTFTWSSVVDASSYRIQLSPDAGFTTVLIDDSTLTVTSKAIAPLQNGTVYYWRVASKNIAGSSPWSGTWRFTTIPPKPGTPALVLPSQDSVGLPTKTRFAWNRVNGEISYRVQICVDSLFVSNLTIDSSLTDTTLESSTMLSDTRYFWRVCASNSGGTSNWSSVRKFMTIVDLPSAVALKVPFIRDTIKADSVLMSWSKGTPKVDRYGLEYAMDSSFSSKIIDSAITDTAVMLRSLKNGNTIWWRVKAHNAAGWGLFSAKQVFTVEMATTGIVPQSFVFSMRGLSTSKGAVRFGLPRATTVSLKVYNTQGRSVYQYHMQTCAAGYHELALPLTCMASGNFVVAFQAGLFRATSSILLTR